MEQFTIHSNANIVNGVYGSIQVLLTVCLLRLIHIFISCDNLRTIYDLRKPLRLKKNSLALIADPGLGPTRITFPLVLGMLSFTALTTVGGFSFVGTTEILYETVPVRNKAVRASPGTYIDFRDHLSLDGHLASSTFVMLDGLYCNEQDTDRVTTFAVTNDMHDLTSVIYSEANRRSNATCLTTQNGFKEEILFECENHYNHFGNDTCNPAREVRVHLNFSEIKRNDFTQIQFSEDENLQHCPFRIAEMWCSNYVSFRCVASIRTEDDSSNYGEILFFFQDEDFTSYTFGCRGRKRHDPEVLKSMAFLSEAMDSVVVSKLYGLATSRIETNATVQKIVGERNVTKVNVSLLLSTFVPALGLLFAAAVVTFTYWLLVVWRPGRKGYNCFCSEADALSCAAQQLYWAQNRTSGREKERQFPPLLVEES